MEEPTIVTKKANILQILFAVLDTTGMNSFIVFHYFLQSFKIFITKIASEERHVKIFKTIWTVCVVIEIMYAISQIITIST